MSETGDTVRLAIEIDTATNEQLKTFLPWGLKTEAIRALINLLIKTQRESSEYIVQDLIRGKCKLVVQNLNNPAVVEIVSELTAKVQYLIDNWPSPLPDGFTFPDGDTWGRSKANDKET